MAQYSRISGDASTGLMDVEEGRESRLLANSSTANLGVTNSVAVSADAVEEEEKAEKTWVFRQKPGIPKPPLPRIRYPLVIRWLLVTFMMFALAYVIVHTFTVQEVVDMHSDESLHVHMENCDMLLKEFDDHAKNPNIRVTIQYWRFLGQGMVKHYHER
jgi:hypothetical protein